MSSQQTTMPVGTTQWTALKKNKKQPTKLSAIKKMEVGLTDDSNRLKDPVVIAITCGEYSHQMVLHRPVGVTTLHPGDWVLTPISEVESLLAFAVDPAKEKKETAKRNLRLEVAIKLTLYKEKDGKITFPETEAIIGGKELTAFNAEAKRLHAEASRRAHDEYIAECKANGRTPKENWKFGQTVNHFLPEEVKRYEEKVRKQVADSTQWKDGLKKIEPNPYETMAGPFSDRPQLAVGRSGKFSATPQQMVDKVKLHLINTMSGGYDFPVPPPPTIASILTDAKDPKGAMDKLAKALFVTPDPPK